MRTIRLSSPSERKSAWGLAAIIALLVIVIMCSLPGGIGYFVLVSLCSLFAVALAAVYLAASIKAAVEIDGESHLRIHGLVSDTVDYSGAVLVKTVPVSSGLLRSRSIVFCDSQGETVCTVPTMFTAHEGVMAEPAAMELAKLLGLDFEATVERWKYDKDAMREHKAEEKRQKKERRRHRKGDASPAENTVEKKEESDGVNYDALDDEK